MRRHGYGISVFGAIVLCCLFFCFPAQSDDNSVSIRVGYYEDGDYMSRGRSAEYIGFNIEFLQKLAKVGGMRYEMLDEGSWENAWHQLLEGHIDRIPAVFRTEEREKEVLFSNLPMGRFMLPSMSELTTNGTVTKISVLSRDAGRHHPGQQRRRAFPALLREVRRQTDHRSLCRDAGVLSALEDGTLDGVAITHLGRSSTFRALPSSLRSRCISLWRRTGRICSPVLMRR